MSIETDDWKLRVRFDWEPKYKTVECPTCNGRGRSHRGFGSCLDEEDDRCTACFGTGKKEQFPKTQQPEIPPDALEHMRRAWYDYTHKPRNPGDGQK